MKQLLNISLSSVCGEALIDAAGTTENIGFMRVYGEAYEAKPGRNNDTIMGDFRATNLTTGEEFRSSVLYLPRGLQETVVMAISACKEGEAVSLAYDIWGEPEPKRKSYKIGFKDLVEDTTAKDRMAEQFKKRLGDLPKTFG